jgi:hypothetical protein
VPVFVTPRPLRPPDRAACHHAPRLRRPTDTRTATLSRVRGETSPRLLSGGKW